MGRRRLPFHFCHSHTSATIFGETNEKPITKSAGSFGGREMCKRLFSYLIISFLAAGCANTASSTSTMGLAVANDMTACSWTVDVGGTTATIAAGDTTTFTSVPMGSTITVTTTAASGDCTIASSSSATSVYSTASTNGTCILASNISTEASSVTVTLEPASGYADSSNTADDAALLCP
jgi:hypothetical protein